MHLRKVLCSMRSEQAVELRRAVEQGRRRQGRALLKRQSVMERWRHQEDKDQHRAKAPPEACRATILHFRAGYF